MTTVPTRPMVAVVGGGKSDPGRFNEATPILEILAKLLVVVLLFAWWVRHRGMKDDRVK
jgi:hypothetical protein